MSKVLAAAILFSTVVVTFAGNRALAQNYPAKPIRIVTSDAGGGTDFTSRAIARGITGPLGQPVVVENRGGTVAPEIVANATPDGYTVLIASSGFWIGPIMRKMNYDPMMDFAPISMLVNSPNILVVHPSLPVKTVEDLVKLAHSKPGELNYSSSIRGSSGHLAGELFKSMAHVNIVNVIYKGTGAALVALISGEVQLSFATSATAAPLIKSGKLRPIAVTSVRPSLLAPDLPTVAAVVPGYDTGGQTAMFAPRRTPPEIVARLNREVVALLRNSSTKDYFLKVGVETVGGTSEELASHLKEEKAKWTKVLNAGGMPYK
jgi:tripartite-type tricarboxylate transporter receptor subunit TctC